MRSKHEIENQIEHFKSACPTAPEETAIWIRALEWVLGDAEHQALYANWLAAIEAEDLPDTASIYERILNLRLKQALERLR